MKLALDVGGGRMRSLDGGGGGMFELFRMSSTVCLDSGSGWCIFGGDIREDDLRLDGVVAKWGLFGVVLEKWCWCW